MVHSLKGGIYKKDKSTVKNSSLNQCILHQNIYQIQMPTWTMLSEPAETNKHVRDQFKIVLKSITWFFILSSIKSKKLFPLILPSSSAKEQAY